MENSGQFQDFFDYLVSASDDTIGPITHDDIPAPYQQPTWSDPTIPKEDYGRLGVINKEIKDQCQDFFDYLASASDDTIGSITHDDIPALYQEPTWSDPTIPKEDWRAVFSRTHTLTNANEGIRSQKINRNLNEIADTILDQYALLLIGSILFVYRPPVWAMIAGNELMRFISEAVRRFFPDDAPYLGDRDRREIAAQLMCHSDVKQMDSFPFIDYNYLCCQDCMYDWHTNECIAHHSSFHRFFALGMNAQDIRNCDGQYWERFLDDLTAGDDLIRGEIKYKDAFTFENTAKLLFVSNYPLQIPNAQQEQALLDRLVCIPCRNSIPKEAQIPQLYQHLLEEAGYIVDLAMDALLGFEERNGIFTPIAESMETGTIRVPDTDQSIMDFVRDCCVLEAGAKCSVSELFEAFCYYEPEDQLDRAQFGKRLIRCFASVEKLRTGKKRGYKGIRLVDSMPN